MSASTLTLLSCSQVGGYSDFEEEDLGELSMTPSRLQLYRQSGPSHSAGAFKVILCTVQRVNGW